MSRSRKPGKIVEPAQTDRVEPSSPALPAAPSVEGLTMSGQALAAFEDPSLDHLVQSAWTTAVAADDVREPGAPSYLLNGLQDSDGLAAAAQQIAAAAPPDVDLWELFDATTGRIDSNLRQVQESLARIDARLGSLAR